MNSNQIKVGIYTLYPDGINPIRKFFESYNCRISVNHFTNDFEKYRIYFGNYGFVKNIRAAIGKQSAKILYLIYDSNVDREIFPLFENEKAVIIDSNIIEDKTVKLVIHHFLAGNVAALRLKCPASINKPEINKVTQKLLKPAKNRLISQNDKQTARREPEANNEYHSHNDLNRINNLIRELYHDGSKPNFKQKIFTPAKCLRYGVALIFTGFVVYAVSLTLTAVFLFLSLKNFPETNKVKNYVFTAKIFFAPAKVINNPATNFFLTRISGMNQTTVVERVISLALESAERAMSTTNQITASINNLNMSERTGGQQLLILAAQTKTEMMAVDQSLALIQTDLNSLFFASKFNTIISSFRHKLEAITDFLTFYEAVSGFDRDRRYLVLFQNAAELRPTGGFIGSVGILEMSNGMISRFDINDVYDLDGQLKGHVEPPEALKVMMGTEHWYLRDSNWSPDFRQSGSKAQWFYETVTGEKLDGVIAVSSLVLTDILSLTGPVYLPDYNETITQDEFYNQSEKIIQKNFFPGSTQKRNFLGSLSDALKKSLSQDLVAQILPLFNLASTALRDGTVLFYSPNETLAALAKRSGWDGSFEDSSSLCLAEKQQSLNCTPLFNGWVDANLSVSKLDNLLARSAEMEIVHRDQALSETKIKYHYLPEKVPPEKASLYYRNANRTYLPVDASEITVELNGQLLSSTPEATLSAFPYVKVSSGSGEFRLVEAGYEIPLSQPSEMTITYLRKVNEEKILPEIVSCRFRLQPGLREIPFSVQIKTQPPFRLRPAGTPGGGLWFATADGYRYNTKITGIHDIVYIFDKKE
jgi:hypothetical protein